MIQQRGSPVVSFILPSSILRHSTSISFGGRQFQPGASGRHKWLPDAQVIVGNEPQIVPKAVVREEAEFSVRMFLTENTTSSRINDPFGKLYRLII